MEKSLPQRALEFAAHAHASVGQVRKYTGAPYIQHPIAVAQLVSTVTTDEVMLAAAFLHDTVEDTRVTLGEIEAEFGSDVARLVNDLTDVSSPEDGNRAQRKAIDLAHTAQADPRAKTVKLADMVDNTRLIAHHDRAFARIYLAEKSRLLEVLGEGDQELFALAVRTLEEGKRLLNMPHMDAA